METLLISACLLGANCKYNGGNNALPPEVLERLRQRYRLIPVCPETAGGLPIPREPSERRGERVINRVGQDVTAEFQKGAELAAALARRFQIRKALLKSNSPSCGSGSIYDGSFSGTLTVGDGVTSEYIKCEGIETVSDYPKIIQD
jgi:uncharacterized protein YbbK (DUF523 family)